MDSERFDQIARAAGRALSRRSALKLLVAGAVPFLLAPAQRRVALADPPLGRCRTGEECQAVADLLWTVCKDGCREDVSNIDTAFQCFFGCKGQHLAQLKHCGISGGCIEGFCQEGICCSSGQVACKGQCLDPHCPSGSGRKFDYGTCSCVCPEGTYACPSGGGAICFAVTCNDGKTPDPATCRCVCPATTCPPGQVQDPDTCGCICPGITCPPGQVQDHATCRCRCPDGCSPSQTKDVTTCECTCGGASCVGACCDGTCVDLQTDRANCGRCGNACAGGKTCQQGRCTCPRDRPDQCNGVCTNFSRDPFACGGCGSVFICPSPFTTCCPSMGGVLGGICTDPKNDGANCGRCGHACTDGKTCQDGRCACPNGMSDCNGQCVDANSTCASVEPPLCLSDGGCGNRAICGPNTPDCFCVLTTEEDAVCVSDSFCDDAPPCLVTDNCSSGAVCIADTCCADSLPRCVPICSSDAARKTTTDSEVVHSTAKRHLVIDL